MSHKAHLSPVASTRVGTAAHSSRAAAATSRPTAPIVDASTARSGPSSKSGPDKLSGVDRAPCRGAPRSKWPPPPPRKGRPEENEAALPRLAADLRLRLLGSEAAAARAIRTYM